jgi:hypothetical protein
MSSGFTFATLYWSHPVTNELEFIFAQKTGKGSNYSFFYHETVGFAKKLFGDLLGLTGQFTDLEKIITNTKAPHLRTPVQFNSGGGTYTHNVYYINIAYAPQLVKALNQFKYYLDQCKTGEGIAKNCNKYPYSVYQNFAVFTKSQVQDMIKSKTFGERDLQALSSFNANVVQLDLLLHPIILPPPTESQIKAGKAIWAQVQKNKNKKSQSLFDMDLEYITKLRNEHDVYFKSLKSRYVAAIKHYTANGFVEMNAYMRGQAVSNPEQVKEYVNNLNLALNNAPVTTKPMTVYRGVKFDNLPKYHKLKAGQLIDLFRDSFNSTSFNINVSSGGYFSDPSCCVFILHLPAGVKGLYVDKNSSVPGEGEFIMAPGPMFRVMKYKHDKVPKVGMPGFPGKLYYHIYCVDCEEAYKKYNNLVYYQLVGPGFTVGKTPTEKEFKTPKQSPIDIAGKVIPKKGDYGESIDFSKEKHLLVPISKFNEAPPEQLQYYKVKISPSYLQPLSQQSIAEITKLHKGCGQDEIMNPKGVCISLASEEAKKIIADLALKYPKPINWTSGLHALLTPNDVNTIEALIPGLVWFPLANYGGHLTNLTNGVAKSTTKNFDAITSAGQYYLLFNDTIGNQAQSNPAKSIELMTLELPKPHWSSYIKVDKYPHLATWYKMKNNKPDQITKELETGTLKPSTPNFFFAQAPPEGIFAKSQGTKYLWYSDAVKTAIKDLKTDADKEAKLTELSKKESDNLPSKNKWSAYITIDFPLSIAPLSQWNILNSPPYGIVSLLNAKSKMPAVPNYYLAESWLSYQVFVTDYLLETLTNIKPGALQEIKSDSAKEAILADLKAKYKEYINKVGLLNLTWTQYQDLTESDVKSISGLDPMLIGSFPSVNQVMKGLNDGTIMPTTYNFKIIKLIEPLQSPYYLISSKSMPVAKKGIESFKSQYASQAKWNAHAVFEMIEPIGNFPQVKWNSQSSAPSISYLNSKQTVPTTENFYAYSIQTYSSYYVTSYYLTFTQQMMEYLYTNNFKDLMTKFKEEIKNIKVPKWNSSHVVNLESNKGQYLSKILNIAITAGDATPALNNSTMKPSTENFYLQKMKDYSYYGETYKLYYSTDIANKKMTPSNLISAFLSELGIDWNTNWCLTTNGSIYMGSPSNLKTSEKSETIFNLLHWSSFSGYPPGDLNSLQIIPPVNDFYPHKYLGLGGSPTYVLYYNQKIHDQIKNLPKDEQVTTLLKLARQQAKAANLLTMGWKQSLSVDKLDDVYDMGTVSVSTVDLSSYMMYLESGTMKPLTTNFAVNKPSVGKLKSTYQLVYTDAIANQVNMYKNNPGIMKTKVLGLAKAEALAEGKGPQPLWNGSWTINLDNITNVGEWTVVGKKADKSKSANELRALPIWSQKITMGAIKALNEGTLQPTLTNYHTYKAEDSYYLLFNRLKTKLSGGADVTIADALQEAKKLGYKPLPQDQIIENLNALTYMNLPIDVQNQLKSLTQSCPYNQIKVKGQCLDITSAKGIEFVKSLTQLVKSQSYSWSTLYSLTLGNPTELYPLDQWISVKFATFPQTIELLNLGKIKAHGHFYPIKDEQSNKHLLAYDSLIANKVAHLQDALEVHNKVKALVQQEQKGIPIIANLDENTYNHLSPSVVKQLAVIALGCNKNMIKGKNGKCVAILSNPGQAVIKELQSQPDIVTPVVNPVINPIVNPIVNPMQPLIEANGLRKVSEYIDAPLLAMLDLGSADLFIVQLLLMGVKSNQKNMLYNAKKNQTLSIKTYVGADWLINFLGLIFATQTIKVDKSLQSYKPHTQNFILYMNDNNNSNYFADLKGNELLTQAEFISQYKSEIALLDQFNPQDSFVFQSMKKSKASILSTLNVSKSTLIIHYCFRRSAPGLTYLLYNLFGPYLSLPTLLFDPLTKKMIDFSQNIMLFHEEMPKLIDLVYLTQDSNPKIQLHQLTSKYAKFQINCIKLFIKPNFEPSAPLQSNLVHNLSPADIVKYLTPKTTLDNVTLNQIATTYQFKTAQNYEDLIISSHYCSEEYDDLNTIGIDLAQPDKSQKCIAVNSQEGKAILTQHYLGQQQPPQQKIPIKHKDPLVSPKPIPVTQPQAINIPNIEAKYLVGLSSTILQKVLEMTKDCSKKPNTIKNPESGICVLINGAVGTKILKKLKDQFPNQPGPIVVPVPIWGPQPPIPAPTPKSVQQPIVVPVQQPIVVPVQVPITEPIQAQNVVSNFTDPYFKTLDLSLQKKLEQLASGCPLNKFISPKTGKCIAISAPTAKKAIADIWEILSKEIAESKAKQEAEKLAKQEAEKIAKQVQQQAEKKTKQEAEKKAKQEADKKVQKKQATEVSNKVIIANIDFELLDGLSTVVLLKVKELAEGCPQNKFKSPKTGTCVAVTSQTGKKILQELIKQLAQENKVVLPKPVDDSPAKPALATDQPKQEAKVIIPNIDEEYLQGLSNATLIKLKALAEGCEKNKFKSPKTGKCIAITGPTGKKALAEL